MKALLLSFVCLFLLTCKGVEEEYITEGEAFTACVGHLYHTSRNSFSIFNVQDSRCPEGAQCFTAGNVVVALSFYRSHPLDTTLELYTKTFGHPELMMDSLSFQLLSVSPGPSIRKKVKQKDYRIEMVVNRK